MANTGTDGQWSWVIAAACCWVTFVIQGLVRCSGVVYVALIDEFGVNRARASWPFTLRMAVWNLSGPVAGALSYRWSIRAITFSGVLLVTVTNVICWFASDITIVTIFLGGIQGLGVGMAVTLIPVIINQYFSKYKSTGAGIACAGATAGSFALPPIVEYALEEYGLRGAFLMMGGITLHGVLGATLMRPAKWLKKKNVAVVKNEQDVANGTCGDQNLNFLKSRSSERLNNEEIKKLLNEVSSVSKPRTKSVRFNFQNDKNTESGDDEDNSLIEASSNHIVVNSQNGVSGYYSLSSALKENNETECKTSHVENPQISYISEDSDGEAMFYGKLEFIDNEPNYDPQINLKPVSTSSFKKEANHSISNSNGVILLPSESFKVQQTAADRNSSKRKFIQGIMEPVKAACQIIKNPMFLIIASNYSVFFLSYMTYLIIIVDYSLDLGVDRTDSVFLVSTFSIADLCGRLGSGWITDSGILKRKNLMMGNMITVGALLIATSFTTTYISVTAVSVSCGLIVGINLILFYALLEEYLGLRQMPMAVGLMNFSIGVISLVTPLLTGFFRDTMGSYDHLFHFLGTLAIVCGLLWLFEPVYTRRNKRRDVARKEIAC